MVKGRGKVEVEKGATIYSGPFSRDGDVEESDLKKQIEKGGGGTYHSFTTRSGDIKIGENKNVRTGAFSGNRI